MCINPDDCARVTESGFKPSFESPHVDFTHLCLATAVGFSRETLRLQQFCKSLRSASEKRTRHVCILVRGQPEEHKPHNGAQDIRALPGFALLKLKPHRPGVNSQEGSARGAFGPPD